MAKKHNRKRIWIWNNLAGLLSVVSILACVVLFFQYRQLDTKQQKDRIERVEQKLDKQQNELNNLKVFRKQNDTSPLFPYVGIILLSIIISIILSIIIARGILRNITTIKAGEETGSLAKWLRGYIVGVVTDSERLNQQRDKLELQTNGKNKSNENNRATNVTQNPEQEKQAQPESEPESVPEELLETEENTAANTPPPPPLIYLKAREGKKFNRVEDSQHGSSFKLVNENGDSAEFEYCATIADARARFNSIFDEVSETEGNVNTAQKVRTTARGKLKLIDGKWEVTTPAKIKFE
jgi:hypothetical protein